MHDTFSEFSFLPAQAAELGGDTVVPPVERLFHPLADGRRVSALRFGLMPPVVTFLHGIGLNAHTFDRTILALGLPSLSIDLPGHGDSSWREDAGYSPAALAEDIAPALAAWSDRPQLIVGQSLGGLTAAALAARHLDLVSGIVIVDITPGVDPGAGPAQISAFFAGPTSWASREELVERALSFGLGGTREAATRGVFLNSRVREDGRVEWKHHIAQLAAAESEASQSVLAALMSPQRQQDGWQHLAEVRAPITLLRAEKGYVTEADAAEFARRVPPASLRSLPAHHNVQEDAPAALAEIIRQALAPRG